MTLYLKGDYRMPVYLKDKEEMSREEFLSFCAANSHLRIERDEHKKIFIMPSVFGETGRKHTHIVFSIENWNRQANSGVTFDSSTGFDLPDGSMRSPDAAWIKKEKWENLTVEERNSFLPFAPDFVVEILSSADRIINARAKMNRWIQNGTQLGWLISPKDEITFIYRADGTVSRIPGFDKKIFGEDVLPGFEFELSVLIG